MKRLIQSLVPTFSLLLVVVGAGCRTLSQPACFEHWPAGASPQAVGKRVAENFLPRRFEFQSGGHEWINYPEVCTWYGALTVAQLTRDRDLRDRLIAKFEPLFTTFSDRVSYRAHVDGRVFGVAPLEIYLQTRAPRYLALGQPFADLQWATTTPDGITTEARYWVDDLFMITAVQVQAYRATGNATYLDRAALTMCSYLERLQQPSGLFFHAPDARFYWSRGNGWVAAGMTELLRALPPQHPRRAAILRGYRRMMAALLPYQRADGLWPQVLDHPEAWSESSGTGMFAYAMVTGVKQGWLDAATYGPAARRAWLGLVQHLDAEANVDAVCQGTNKGFDLPYYLARKRINGDLHGQAPILWTASALLR